jgi:chloramphenicol 3-O-phosphotransferase
MKRLILLSGTMGAGKTETCRELLDILQPGVWLDGDWCWNMKPFTVTDETKAMVMDHITHLLRGFLQCSAYENVIFCWVMHEQSIIDDVLMGLAGLDFSLHAFTLTLSAQALTRRIGKDVRAGTRTPDVLQRSLARLPLYDMLHTVKIDVSDIPPRQAAEKIRQLIIP